ncbi:MAG TPA: hypothetical protein VMT16_05975 [Thermoanaerobaculia bacterium]|nr:hypothetical protein [Thermoanaerobaculia bacterium]
MNVIVATHERLLIADPAGGAVGEARDLDGRRLTCLATDPLSPARAWCGTSGDGIWRSDDAGRSWRAMGLAGEELTAVAASPVEPDLVWAGTEPSALWRSDDGGASWRQLAGLDALPSAAEWSFPPRPQTHHVRWVACHPHHAGRLWLAIEAGALVTTADGGVSWRDRVAGGPYDTHELAIHPALPDTLRVAAGDGYYESHDAGATWESPDEGLAVGYLRSVTIDPGDPGTVLVSAASHPHAAYVTGLADGRVYRRQGSGRWQAVQAGWPDPPRTIAPLLAAGRAPGELWAADERGVHRSADGGRGWEALASFAPTPSSLRGMALVD